jgi:Gram-negative bacterial TonB protein C-terminal
MQPYSSPILLALSFAILGSSASGETDKGVCPPASGSSVAVSKRAIPAPPVSGVHYVGTVTLSLSLSDTGYLCAVAVVNGISEALDKQTVDAIRQQIFQPIRQGGKPVPGLMTVQRDFWRGDTSDLLVSQNADASPDEIPSDAKLFKALDVPALIASGKVAGESYRNQYFGVSFTAQGGAFTAPSAVDEQGRNVRLVEAVVSPQKREAMYTISILADRVSNYPALKSRTEYVNSISSQLERDGAKRTRDDFPYLISGVEFTCAMLRESDGPDLSHFRGIFTTVMKGYPLSLDIAATSEDQVLKTASSIEFKPGR